MLHVEPESASLRELLEADGRDVALTAPYMHDGSVATLDAVVEFYSDGGIRNPSLDPRLRAPRFSVQEKRQLVAFLKALNGRIPEGLPGPR